MRRFLPLLLLIAGLIAGTAGGRFLLAPQPAAPDEQAAQNRNDGREDEASTAREPADTVILRWRMASSFPSRLPQYGTLAERFASKVADASDGAMQIEIAEPGELVPPDRCIDALTEGAVQACWSSPGHWYSRESALAIFAGAPFGPSTREYAAWYYYGGGRELLDEIYASHGVKSVLCGVTAPEAGGWFRREINEVGDLQGLRMRFFGLGARVLGKLGVVTFRLQGSEIVNSLREDRIDATEYSMPVVDAQMGFEQVARYYYFPGWHQQTTLLEFLIARESWANLSETNRAIIRLACGDNVREGLAEGEALQARALRELRSRGAELRRWPPEVLQAMHEAWLEVVAEEREADTTFKRVWDAYAEFRSVYARWERLGYVDPNEVPDERVGDGDGGGNGEDGD